MIDYKSIGGKIRKKRKELNISQEKLAEACDVGTTHISHIETGNCIPSLKVFIAILNTLSCSADELLCGELDNSGNFYAHQLAELLADCDSREMRIISDTVLSLKNSLRK